MRARALFCSRALPALLLGLAAARPLACHVRLCRPLHPRPLLCRLARRALVCRRPLEPLRRLLKGRRESRSRSRGRRSLSRPLPCRAPSVRARPRRLGVPQRGDDHKVLPVLVTINLHPPPFFLSPLPLSPSSSTPLPSSRTPSTKSSLDRFFRRHLGPAQDSSSRSSFIEKRKPSSTTTIYPPFTTSGSGSRCLPGEARLSAR